MSVVKREQREDIDYIRERVLRKFPLLGVTMASLGTVADNRIETAATDGRKVYYSPDFFKTLTDDEKVFTYAHEVMHVAFNHILRSKGRNPRLWNIATDAVINQILKNEELPMVEGGVDMAEAVNHSAEEMYEKLLQKQQEKQQQSGQDNQDDQSDQSGQSEQNGGEENEQAGHDSHEIWKQAVERAEKQQQKPSAAENENGEEKQSENEEKNEGKSFLDKIKDLFNKEKTPPENKESEQSSSAGEKQEMPESQKQNSSGEDGGETRRKGQENEWEKNFLEENKEERQNRAAQIRRSLEQQKNTVMKNLTETGKHSLGPVGESKAVLDWKKLLKKTIEDENDRWSYRRSGADNDYMARVEELEEENRSETEVMLDVSGSVDEEMLKEFLRQLKPILKNSKLKVGCFDHRVYGFSEIKNNRDIDSFNIPGGGGTNIDLAVRAFSKKKDVNKIVFTDGYSNDMPKSDLKGTNVIWLIYDNDDFRPVCGKVIYVSKKQIRQRFLNMAAIELGGR